MNKEPISGEEEFGNDQKTSNLSQEPTFNVLIFDDNPMDYELIQLYLRKETQYNLIYVSNFELFKTKVIEFEIHTIICDYDLGSMDALEVYTYIKDKNFSIPFIVVSGAQGEEKAVEILRAGLTDYVLKDKYEKMPFILSRALREHESQVHEKYMIERLRESENKFREIFNSIIDVYFESDLDGLERVISPSIYNVLGFHPEEIIGEKATNLYVNPQQRTEFIQELLEKGRVYDFEMLLYSKDKTPHDISTNAQLVYDSGNNPIGIKGVYRDITEKKKQQKRLIQREAQLRESQKMAKLGSWEMDPKEKKIVLSDEFFQIFELPVDKKERFDFYDFLTMVHPDDRMRLESNMIKFMKNGNELPYEFRIVTPNGRMKFLSTKVFKDNRTGNKELVTGIVQDITDLKLLEEEKNNVQRQALEMLEEMVEQRTKKIEEQRMVIEQKNRDITDSIQYAKQVQMAIMPSKETIDSHLPQNFILYLPKAIVAGDFYWTFSDQNYFMIAVADCTGHGVPGALVSVICYSALNRAVNEYNLRCPGEILTKANTLVIDFFSHGVSTIKDGMDISLMVIETKTKKIKWSGANNPLVYFQDSEMVKINANKTSIGNKEMKEAFVSHDVPYLTDSTYYLFTDGYADQFGGPQNKKFMQKRFLDLMESANKMTMIKQNELFIRTFEEWKGNNEQVDDVALIAFKLPPMIG